MKITIISVGKLKEKYLIDGINEYSKRITKYSKIEFIEVNDEATPDNCSLKQIEEIKNIEGEKILNKVDLKSYIIVLDLKGEMLKSEELANKFLDIQSYYSSSITFIIGGSLGLANEVIAKANYRLCFSKMTFPHQLMKLILLEQIYRAFKINNNETYHK